MAMGGDEALRMLHAAMIKYKKNITITNYNNPKK
jgi:hypothetical protein